MKRTLACLVMGLTAIATNGEIIYQFQDVTIIARRELQESNTIYEASGGMGGYATDKLDRAGDPIIALYSPYSPDARCNPATLTSELLRTTTSQSDLTTKFVAANTLFRAIYAKVGGNGMQASIGLLPRSGVTSGGKEALIWTTTWMDGSTSAFLVFPFLPPLFTDQQPSSNADSPATGSSTCPVKG